MEHESPNSSSLDGVDDNSVLQPSVGQPSSDIVATRHPCISTAQSGWAAGGGQNQDVEARPASNHGQNVINVKHPAGSANELSELLGGDISSDFSSKDCDRNFTTKVGDLEHSKDRHGGYNCEACKKSFKDKLAGLQHMRMKHGAEVCLPCCELFTAKADLAEHNGKVHVISVGTPSASSMRVLNGAEASTSLVCAQRCQQAPTSSATCSDCSCTSVTQLQEHLASRPCSVQVQSMGWFGCFLCGTKCGLVDQQQTDGAPCPLCQSVCGPDPSAVAIAQQARNIVAQPVTFASAQVPVLESAGAAVMTEWEESQPAALAPIVCIECRREFPNKKALFMHSKDKHGAQVCFECEKNFPHRRALLQHLNMKHGLPVCLPCECLFQKEGDLHEHTALQHDVSPEDSGETESSESEAVICLDCGKDMATKKDLLLHQNRRHGLTFCLPCEKTFKTKESMLQHMKMKHNAPVCFVCEIKFQEPAALLQHMETAHGENADAWRAPPWQQPSGKAAEPKRLPLHCEVCDRDFSNEDALFQHNRDKHPPVYSCGPCEREFTCQQALDNHNRDKHPPPYSCSPCEREFTCQQALDNHKRDKHALNCPSCSVSFPNEDMLQQHNQQQHNYRCSICNKQFDKPLGYINHMKDKHQILRPNNTGTVAEEVCFDAAAGRASTSLQHGDIPCFLCKEICKGLGSFTHHIMEGHKNLADHISLFVNAVLTSFEPTPGQLSKEVMPELQSQSQPQATKFVPQPQATKLVPQPQATKLVPQPQATKLVPQPQVTKLVPQSQATKLVPQPQATKLVPQPQATKLTPQPQATKLVPQPQATKLVPQPQATKLVPQSQATKLVPQPQVTKLAPQLQTTPIMSQPWAPRLMCPFCDMRSDLLKDVVQHMRAKHITLTCSVCEQICKNHEALYQHIRDRHGGKAKLPVAAAAAATIQMSPQVACPTCGQMFQNQARMQRHSTDKHRQVPFNPEKTETQKTQYEFPPFQASVPSLQHLSDRGPTQFSQAPELSHPEYNATCKSGEEVFQHLHGQHSLPVAQLTRTDIVCLVCFHSFSTIGERDAHIQMMHKTSDSGYQPGISCEYELDPNACNVVPMTEACDVRPRSVSNASSNESSNHALSYSDIVRKKSYTDFKEKGQTFATKAASKVRSVNGDRAASATQLQVESLPFSQREPPALAYGPARLHARSLHSYILRRSEGDFQCSKCQFVAKGYQPVSLHLLQDHNIMLPATSQPLASNSDTATDLPLACKHCETRFATAKALSKHVMQKKCPVLQNIHSRAAAPPNLAQSAPLRCKMQDCNQTFTNATAQCQHMFDKHGMLSKGDHVCKLCRKKIPSTMAYHQHMDAHRRAGHTKK